MKGLYKGKYLIVLYGKDGLPSIVAASRVEFIDMYTKYTGAKSKHAAEAMLHRVLNGLYKKNKICLVEADTITHDCFEEEDKDFINFVENTREKTSAEIAKEMGITPRTYFRRLRSGYIKKPVSED